MSAHVFNVKGPWTVIYYDASFRFVCHCEISEFFFYMIWPIGSVTKTKCFYNIINFYFIVTSSNFQSLPCNDFSLDHEMTKIQKSIN